MLPLLQHSRGYQFRERKCPVVGSGICVLSILTRSRSRKPNMHAICGKNLQPHLVPFLQDHGPRLVLMHNNTLHHRVPLARNFLDEDSINRLSPSPSHSPEINQIEHLWDSIDRPVRAFQNPPRTLNELAYHLINAWNFTSQKTSELLCSIQEGDVQLWSMPKAISPLLTVFFLL